jgi:hypothetical protein
VPVERPAGCGAGTNSDSEIKCPGLATESKLAATSYRMHRVFGPHGNDRYNLDPVMDQKPVRREQQHSCWSMLSTYISSLICFTLHYLPSLVPYSLSHHTVYRYIMYQNTLRSHLLVTSYSLHTICLLVWHTPPPLLSQSSLDSTFLRDLNPLKPEVS